MTYAACRFTLSAPRATMAALLVPIAIISVQPAGSHGQEPVVRDSAGIRIVENAASGADLPLWTLADAPDVVIGTRAGSEEFALHGVGAARFLSDGGIVVQNNSVDLLWFDPEGRLQHRGAGRGEGPAESLSLIRVEVLAGDTVLAVSKRRHPSRKLFGADGRFVRSVPMQIPGMVATMGRLGTEAWAGLAFGEESPPARTGTFHETWYVMRYASDLSAADTLRSLDGSMYYGDTRGFVPVLGGSRLYFAVRGDVLVTGESDTYELQVHGADGELRHVIRNASPNPDELQLVYLSEDRPDRGPSEPPAPPAFNGIFVANDGAVWVRRRTGPNAETVLATRMFSNSPLPSGRAVWVSEGLQGHEWHVYDRDGRLTARAMFPPGLRPTEITDSRILGVWKDELGVEYVHAYRLNRG